MGALDGVRVVDLTRLLAGGYLTMVLVDHGAEVTKVEQPPSGEPMRTTPPRTTTGEGALHVALDRGKGSAALDLRTDAGRAALLAMVDDAHLLVESFRPGVLERLGVGWEVLHERNPALVLVSLTGDGPTSHRPAHDLNAQAEAGALLLPRLASGPDLPATQVADLGAALHATVGALAALRHASATGQGQRVSVSMADAALALLPVATSAAAVTGGAPEPGADALTGALACYATYRCADDRWLAVAALEPVFFTRLVELIGEPGLAAWQYDPTRQDALRGRLAEVLAGRPRHEWLTVLAGQDTCVTAVLDVAEAMDAGRARGALVPTLLPDGTPFDQVAPPARLSATPARVGGHPAPLGAGAPVDPVVGGPS